MHERNENLLPDLEANLKQAYLKQIEDELRINHPANVPYSLKCVITRELIKDPVISFYGRVYEKEVINEWVSRQGSDELSQPLTQARLYSFKELEEYIKNYSKSLRLFETRKQAILDEAREKAIPKTKKLCSPFICPISQALLKTPVISREAKVYDQNSLSPDSAIITVPFPELVPYLNFYRRELEKSQAQPIVVSNNSYLRQCANFIYSQLSFFVNLQTSQRQENSSLLQDNDSNLP